MRQGENHIGRWVMASLSRGVRDARDYRHPGAKVTASLPGVLQSRSSIQERISGVRRLRAMVKMS